MTIQHTRAFTAVVAWLVLASTPLHALVISELHYNPAAGKEALSFVELTNEADSPEDISGWALVDGIGFVFPPGTVLKGREILAVCADEAAVRSSYSTDNAMGNYERRLDSSGERLTLVNHVGVVIQSLRYSDGEKWSVGADGTGHSLVLKNLQLDNSKPANWRLSSQLGGNPGFPDDHEPGRFLLPQTTAERGLVFNELYRGADSESAWVEVFNSRSEAFDLSGWSLTDDPDRNDPYIFPVGSTLSGGGFLVVVGISTSLFLSAPEVQLFLRSPLGVVGVATAF